MDSGQALAIAARLSFKLAQFAPSAEKTRQFFVNRDANAG
jgi:hypothetical protein